MSLRARLLLLVLVAAAPTLVVAAALERLMTARLEEGARQRLAAIHTALGAHLDRLRARAAAQVAAVAHEDLVGLASDPDLLPSLASGLAQRRDLPLLEILDGGGRILSSAHWPVGMGLPDRDQVFAGPLGLRLESVGDEYGQARRLAVSAEQPALWQGAPVLVRGGVFLDDALLSELAGLTQAELALQEEASGRVLVPAISPLAGTGPDQDADERWRFARRELGAGLALVAAVPRREADALVAEARRATLTAAALALAAGLLGALVLARRLERPVSALAEGARRLEAGALGSRVPEAGPPEVRDLARAMNAMSTALAASQSRLVQAERVASWREMARRLAHELKNPIFPIQLSVETLRRTLDRRDAGEPPAQPPFEQLFRESSETILQALRSLRRIVDEFSDFARLPQPSLVSTDLNTVAEGVLGLYRARAGQVLVEAALAPQLPPVSADPELLARALGNLVANALEAMPQGGTLRVATEARPEGVALTVADSGPGLDEEQRGRLFTPYFTTKPGGTGLGLAIVQSIVSDHGGRIEVASERGQGTTFTLLLPRASRTAAA